MLGQKLDMLEKAVPVGWGCDSKIAITEFKIFGI